MWSDPLTPNEFSRRAPEAKVAAMLASLEERGIIESRPAGEGRRQYRLRVENWPNVRPYQPTAAEIAGGAR